jgi:hypothetical protein
MLFVEFEPQHKMNSKDSSKKTRITLMEMKNLILKHKLASVKEHINL